MFVFQEPKKFHVSVKRRALVTLFSRLQGMGMRILPDSALKPHHRETALLFRHDWTLSGVPALLDGVVTSTRGEHAAADANTYFFRSVLGLQHIRLAAIRGCHQVRRAAVVVHCS